MKPSQRSKTILVVDDHQETADTLVSLLCLMGHSASAAYDGSSAIELANLRAPVIAIVDITMPYMDGFVTAEGILALRQPRRPYLVAFTTPRQDLWPRIERAGFDSFLAKPLSGPQLELMLARILV